MRGLSGMVGDVLLGGAAVVVLGGAVFALKQSPAPTPSPSPVALSQPSPTATPEVTGQTQPQAVTTARTVVLIGPDLEPLTSALAQATGDTVDATTAATPDIVVIEIQAGTKTTPRTTAAIIAAQASWPSAKVYVVGPFSSNDRKSAASAKAAATTAGVTFLDPVELNWRTDAAPAPSAADEPSITAGLAAALNP